MRKYCLLVFLCMLGISLRFAEAAEPWETLPATPAPISGGQSNFANVNGIRLFHVEIGAGPPVVLLHGGLGNSDYLSEQARALAPAHRVILVDSRGHGRSTRDQRPFGYDLMADDVVALLDTLKIDKAAIIGWSDGGIIGLDIAMRHPERVTRVFAFGANTSKSGLKEDFDKILLSPPISSVPAGNMRSSPQHRRSTPPFKSRSARCGKANRTGPMRSSARFGYRCGWWTASTTKASNATIPNIWPRQFQALELLILSNVSHFAFLQDPVAFNKAILSFLGGRQQGAPRTPRAHR